MSKRIITHENTKNKEILVIIAYIIISLIGMLIGSCMYESSYICYYLTFFSGAHLAATIVLMRRYTGKWLIFYNIFMGLLYLFHMGQVVLRTFFNKYEYLKLNLYALEGKIDYVDAALFSLRMLIFFAIGGVLYAYCNRNEDAVSFENNIRYRKNNKDEVKKEDSNTDKETLKLFGKITIINHIQKYLFEI